MTTWCSRGGTRGDIWHIFFSSKWSFVKRHACFPGSVGWSLLGPLIPGAQWREVVYKRPRLTTIYTYCMWRGKKGKVCKEMVNGNGKVRIGEEKGMHMCVKGTGISQLQKDEACASQQGFTEGRALCQRWRKAEHCDKVSGWSSCLLAVGRRCKDWVLASRGVWMFVIQRIHITKLSCHEKRE